MIWLDLLYDRFMWILTATLTTNLDRKACNVGKNKFLIWDEIKMTLNLKDKV